MNDLALITPELRPGALTTTTGTLSDDEATRTLEYAERSMAASSLVAYRADCRSGRWHTAPARCRPVPP